ncbi:hypothetical protein K488DRAFT_44774 [Vararia minispora EC-137]|uniref:Uncharacterized protein n=1 Tax=Vararia minispora EC-137 TaxID=1314806 RepID=A0ACB8QT66_9AGAM|nr:hypothetical protein K488DRAFT_44774 [Vararia minispora EC-137]
MRLTSSQSSHRLDIPLPKPGGQPFAPEMVTIAAMKGDRLDVTADAWHLEENCHFEWHIAFPPETVDMASIRAEFDRQGNLAIKVRRTKSAGKATERPVVL